MFDAHSTDAVNLICEAEDFFVTFSQVIRI